MKFLHFISLYSFSNIRLVAATKILNQGDTCELLPDTSSQEEVVERGGIIFCKLYKCRKRNHWLYQFFSLHPLNTDCFIIHISEQYKLYQLSTEQSFLIVSFEY